MRLIVLGGVLLLAAIGGTVQAKVYKWTDAQGRVHYSATPPAEGRASEVPIAPTPAAAPAQPAAAGEPKPDTANGEQKPADAARGEALQQNCEIAKQNLTTLENPANRRFQEAGKEPVYYTDEQRQAKIGEAKKMVTAFCEQDGKQ